MTNEDAKRFTVFILLVAALWIVGNALQQLDFVEPHYGMSAWVTQDNSPERFGIVLNEDSLYFVLIQPNDREITRLPLTKTQMPRQYTNRMGDLRVAIIVIDEQVLQLEFRKDGDSRVEIWLLKRVKKQPIQKRDQNI